VQALHYLDGEWRLLYTSDASVNTFLSIANRLPVITLGGIFQRIDHKSLTSETRIHISHPLPCNFSATSPSPRQRSGRKALAARMPCTSNATSYKPSVNATGSPDHTVKVGHASTMNAGSVISSTLQKAVDKKDPQLAQPNGDLEVVHGHQTHVRTAALFTCLSMPAFIRLGGTAIDLQPLQEALAMVQHNLQNVHRSLLHGNEGSSMQQELGLDRLESQTEAAPYLLTTFVDEDTRLARTADGALTVFVRHHRPHDDTYA
jgi:hypothetical protein